MLCGVDADTAFLHRQKFSISEQRYRLWATSQLSAFTAIITN
jgi:hypothetical protein